MVLDFIRIITIANYCYTINNKLILCLKILHKKMTFVILYTYSNSYFARHSRRNRYLNTNSKIKKGREIFFKFYLLAGEVCRFVKAISLSYKINIL
jgi:hypothetical protein